MRNGLYMYPKELRERIFVIGIAPGAYINDKTCGGVTHYRTEATQDFIPQFDIVGRHRFNHTTNLLRSPPNPDFTYHAYRNPIYEPVVTRESKFYLNKFMEPN